MSNEVNSLKVSFTLCPSYNEHYYNQIKFINNSMEKAIGSYWKLNDNYHKIFVTSLDDAHYEADIMILTMIRHCKICSSNCRTNSSA